jgi:hypothetical protein
MNRPVRVDEGYPGSKEPSLLRPSRAPAGAQPKAVRVSDHPRKLKFHVEPVQGKTYRVVLYGHVLDDTEEFLARLAAMLRVDKKLCGALI